MVAPRLTVFLTRTVVRSRCATRATWCLVGRPAPDRPSVPDGITGKTVWGDPACPVAIAGISTGPTATDAGWPTEADRGSETTGSFGAAGSATSTCVACATTAFASVIAASTCAFA